MAERGKIYIAAMNMRGAWAPLPADIVANCVLVNATSAQALNNKNRRDFSPMTAIAGGYKGYYNFESYWQSGKKFKDIPHAESQAWWKRCREAKRRYPLVSRGHTVEYARFDHIDADLGYIESRKRVYVMEYHDLIKEREMTLYWAGRLNQGVNIVVYDFDGPRGEDGEPECAEITLDLLRTKINYENTPFGHGYVVAATIAGIPIEDYIGDDDEE